MTHSRRAVLVLGLAAMISMGSPSQGQLFPELRTYSENQVEIVTCPRNCSRDGDSVSFCIFDNASNASNQLRNYLSSNELVDNQANGCNGRTSGSDTTIISFRVTQRMSGSTIYCVPAIELCSSLHNTLISPLLINVEAENRCSNGEDLPTLTPIPSQTPILPATNIASATHITSTLPATPTPPPTLTTSAENLSSTLPTPSSMPNFTQTWTEAELVGIAVGVFIAGLLLGVICGIGITCLYSSWRSHPMKIRSNSSSQEIQTMHDTSSGSSLED